MDAPHVEETDAPVKVTVAPSGTARFLRRVLHFWIVGVGILVTVTIIGEISARAVLYRLPSGWFQNLAAYDQYDKRPDAKFQFSFQQGFGLYPRPGYSNGGDYDKHNSLGFRGGEIVSPKPEGSFRIACLGGSTTYDVQVANWTKAYPAQLFSELRARGVPAEVVNAGCPGWTSREQVLNYVTRVSYLEPDMIVFFEPINDLSTRANWPPESLRSDYTDPQIIVPEFARQPWYMSLAVLRMPLMLTGVIPWGQLNLDWVNSNLRTGADNIIWKIGAADFSLPRPGPCSIPAGMTLKDVFAAIPTEFFVNNITSIVALAKQRHTMVLLVSGILDWKSFEECPDHGEGMHYGVAQMNAALAKIASEQNVLYYDLASEWPNDDGTTVRWSDGFHNNATGAHLKAELIAKYIVKARAEAI